MSDSSNLNAGRDAIGEQHVQGDAVAGDKHVNTGTQIKDSKVIGPVVDKNTGTVSPTYNINEFHPPGTLPDAATDDPAAQQLFASMPTDDPPDPAPLPPGSRPVLAPNPLFVGRRDDLLRVARTIRDSPTVGIVAATGTGGMGKTQLACEFAHRYGRFFAGGVFWLSFEDAGGIKAEIAACGGPGGLGLYADRDQFSLDEQVARVQAAWRSPLPRLLIFDNCENEALLDEWRPTSGGCRVLLTSRRDRWSQSLHVAALPLHELAPADSMALLRGFLPTAADTDLRAVADELGHLPLALHLAGSFMADNDMRPAAYLKRIKQPNPLADRSLTRSTQTLPTRHERDVARTFAVSYEQLDAERDALALRLLHRAAHFAPGEPIPRWLLLLTVGVADAEEDGDDVSDDVLDALAALRRLAALGLIERADAHTVRLHRLVAAFVRGVATDDAARTATEDAMLRVADHFNNEGIPAPLLALQTHLRHITDAAQERTDELAAGLCNTLGYHLKMIGDYAGAKPYYERALAIREQVLGPQHPDTALSLNNLGALLDSQGDYAGARPYYERALAIREQVLGPQHPATARSLNNLGALLDSQGDYAGARPYYERALAIREQALGPQHPATARSLNNLGSLLQAQGDLAGAKPYYERALAIREQVLGPQHPATALSLNNLGGLLQAQGDYAGARGYYERALAIWEQALGPQHPDTAMSLNNLGYLLQAQGDYAGARPYYERALAIWEQVLGPQHPDTATSLNNLGGLLRAQGDDAGAKPYYERALAIREQVLGPQHPDTAQSLNNLAILCYYENDIEQAATLMRRALSIRHAVLGDAHPDTQSSRQSLEIIEQRLAGTTPPSAAQQIAAIDQQAQEAMAQALAQGSAAQRDTLAQQFEEVAAQAAEGEPDGSAWLALAVRLRAWAAELRTAEGHAPQGLLDRVRAWAGWRK